MNCPLRLVFFVLFQFFFFVNCGRDTVCLLGELKGGQSVEFVDLVENAESYVGVSIQVKGTVDTSSIFGKNGSWAILRGQSPSGKGMVLLTVQDKEFSFPFDDFGVEPSNVLVDGVFDIMDLGDNLFSLHISVVGIQIVGDGVCSKWGNTVITQDLRKGGLHGPGLGSGQVCLAQNQTEPLHSTEESTEIVAVFEGRVHVKISRGGVYEVHEIEESNAILIPPGTPHMVINPFEKTGCYFYFHADVGSSL